MPDRKRRLLMVNEFSRLTSGYATYGHELLTRLHDSGKYEVAELACNCEVAPPGIPWKVYPNVPAHKDQYRENPLNQFGLYRFNDTCLDFRPDVVFAIRDPYMDDFIERSPFRPYFYWVEMATVDAIPQQEQWIATYTNADAVLAYTDWGADVLREQGGGLINVRGSAPPGADFDTFFPMDRSAIRRHFGVDEDAIVIGFVARNQVRKLFPNLLRAFARFLKEAPEEISRRAYLYLHTSYPDAGWDIPALIKHSGISHKIALTYICHRCNAAMPCLYQDVRGSCPKCTHTDAVLPNVRNAVDRHTLAMIYNVFDVYVQYASNEGFGMPMVEAAACGVPVFATDYSAMSDVVRKLGGQPIKVAHMQMDPSLGTYKAIPHDEHLVECLIDHFTISPEFQDQLSGDAMDGAGRHYTWRRTATTWMNVFDSLPLRDAWASAPRIHSSPAVPEMFGTHEEMVRWGLTHYLGRPELVSSYMALKYMRDLNWGFRLEGTNVKDFSIEAFFRELTQIRNNFNQWEARR